jgi:hypothetical protein
MGNSDILNTGFSSITLPVQGIITYIPVLIVSEHYPELADFLWA